MSTSTWILRHHNQVPMPSDMFKKGKRARKNLITTECKHNTQTYLPVKQA